jgi:hypothetical protein
MRALALARAALLLGLASLALAMEVNDLRLEYSPIQGKEYSQQGSASYALVNGSGTITSYTNQSVSRTEAASEHTRWALSYRRSVGALRSGLGAPLWGVSLVEDRVVQRQNVHNAVANITTETTGISYLLDGVIGWAWRVMPGWHVEEGFILGMGQSRWAFHVPTGWADNTDQDYATRSFTYEYGFFLGTGYTFSDHFEVGLDVRHLVMRSAVTANAAHDVGGSNQQFEEFNGTIEVRGLGVTMNAGYRF